MGPIPHEECRSRSESSRIFRNASLTMKRKKLLKLSVDNRGNAVENHPVDPPNWCSWYPLA